MKIIGILALLLPLFSLATGCLSAEGPIITIAVSEGSAVSNAIDVLGQMKSPGFVIVSAANNIDISSDLAETAYDCAFHMAAITCRASSRQAIVKRLDELQSTADFRLTGKYAVVAIPKSDSAIDHLVALLDIPLGIGAGTTFEFEARNTLYDPIIAAAKKCSLVLDSVMIDEPEHLRFFLQSDTPFYFSTGIPPRLKPVEMSPDTTLREVLLAQISANPNLIWIFQLRGSSLLITTTRVKFSRTELPLKAILTQLDPSISELGEYPDIISRIHDACRELGRRMILDPVTTEKALEESGVLRKLLPLIVSKEEKFKRFNDIDYILGLRNASLTRMLLSAAYAAPKSVFRQFVVADLPGIHGGDPVWAELYKPIWTKLLASSENDIALIARLRLKETVKK